MQNACYLFLWNYMLCSNLGVVQKSHATRLGHLFYNVYFPNFKLIMAMETNTQNCDAIGR